MIKVSELMNILKDVDPDRVVQFTYDYRVGGGKVTVIDAADVRDLEWDDEGSKAILVPAIILRGEPKDQYDYHMSERALRDGEDDEYNLTTLYTKFDR
jgi:hypothetical protein